MGYKPRCRVSMRRATAECDSASTEAVGYCRMMIVAHAPVPTNRTQITPARQHSCGALRYSILV